MMNINEKHMQRMAAIAVTKAPVLATFCAAKKATAEAQQELCLKRLMWQYVDIPDHQREQWLYEQENA